MPADATPILIACDHAGLPLKLELRRALEEEGYRTIDLGTDTTDSVDYPIYARKLAESLLAGQAPLGVLVCGTGIGISIAANKIPGIRAACVSEPFSARMSRAHNDANVLCLGARVVGAGLAREIALAFLTTPFEGGRHQRRVDQIGELDASRR